MPEIGTKNIEFDELDENEELDENYESDDKNERDTIVDDDFLDIFKLNHSKELTEI